MRQIVKINNLVKRYGTDKLAVDHFSLDIQEGEILGLLGPNGSGKTTTINCLLSLLTYDKGEITIFNKKMAPNNYKVKQDIGVVAQNVAVFEELTTYENIDYFCGLYVRNKEKRKELVEEAIDFVGLGEYKKYYPKQLSGGLLRRLNIACGIAHKPKLIIFDEPTVAVDPQSRNKILEGIKELNKAGATVIYTSHYMEEVEQICSRVAIIDNGKKIAEGTKEELKTMIQTGETIRIETLDITDKQVQEISALSNVINARFKDKMLIVKCKSGNNNLMLILDYFRKNDLNCGRVLSELPTLNDVFLEITGKELRD